LKIIEKIFFLANGTYNYLDESDCKNKNTDNFNTNIQTIKHNNSENFANDQAKGRLQGNFNKIYKIK
jgi:nickel-dependent lactate racemase